MNIIGNTDTVITDSFRGILSQYVNNGGIVVMNTNQITVADQTLTGVQLTGTSGTSTSSVWTADNSTSTEKSYTYAKVTPSTATVVAKAGNGDALLTKTRLARVKFMS